jgi:hypothetical protein
MVARNIMTQPRELLKRLSKPFPAKDIEWRVGRAVNTKNGISIIPLAYITARAVMDRLDEVMGPEGWTDDIRTVEFEVYNHDGVARKQLGFLCSLTCYFGTSAVTKTDGAEATDMESFKGGASSALKRAAVKFGIGRYLYDLGESWCDLVQDKSSDSEYFSGIVKGLDGIQRGYWSPPKLPEWALPEVEPLNVHSAIGDYKIQCRESKHYGKTLNMINIEAPAWFMFVLDDQTRCAAMPAQDVDAMAAFVDELQYNAGVEND